MPVEPEPSGPPATSVDGLRDRAGTVRHGRDDARATADAAEVVRRRVLLPVTVALLGTAAVCAVVALLGGQVPERLQLVPFAVSILVFGLPHGALDHLVPARLARGVSVRRSIVTVVGLYLLVGGATAALWVVHPLLGFAGFIALTWFHWGQGDLWVDQLLGSTRAGRMQAAPTLAGRARIRAALTVASRGALPMAVPLVAHPAAYAAVVDGTTRLLDPNGPSVVAVLEAPTTRLVVAVVVALLLAVDLLGRRGQCGYLVETLTLVVFFGIVPPVLAVGLYFTLWHSVRHIVRLELLDPPSAVRLARGQLVSPFLRFLRQAWPITAIAVVMLVVLAVLLHRADLGVYLALIAALTTPHAVVVTWMDRVQRTWR